MRTIGEAHEEFNNCNGRDCIIYDLSTQSTCTEITENETWDSRWEIGLSLQMDDTIKGGDIVAYQIRWFNGQWSGWFIPGVNDIDVKYNMSNSTLRRMWSYFGDHTHKYIICK